MNIKLVTVFLVLVSACSVGPVDDPADRMPDIPEGPGFFSGDKGDFSFSDFFGEEENQAAQKENPGSINTSPSYGSNTNISIPAIDPQSFEEFETFKAWRRSSQPDSIDFQEFQDWKAYQQYRRFKTQQEQTNETSPQ